MEACRSFAEYFVPIHPLAPWDFLSFFFVISVLMSLQQFLLIAKMLDRTLAQEEQSRQK